MSTAGGSRPARAGSRGAARTVFACELTRLLRDRRAILAAVVLPMLLYPLIFLGTERLQELSRESLADRRVTVVHDLDALPPALAARVLAPLETDPDTLRLERVETSALAAPGPDPESLARALLGPERQVLLLGRPPGTGPDAPGGAEPRARGGGGDGGEAGTADGDAPPDPRPRLELWFDGSNELSGEALRRVSEALRDLAAEIRTERMTAVLGRDPGAGLEARPVDVASETDTGGLALGRLLPLLAVLALLSGASMAALDVFSAEREAGTLETLLVQPVRGADLARGKFAVVAATGTVALFGNAGSLIACAALGLGKLPGLDASQAGGAAALGGLRLAAGALLFLPTVVLLSAWLSIAAARARSFREGQHAVLPITLLALVPASLPMARSIELDPLVAAIPIAGPALALRDALSGQLRLLPALTMFLAHVGWAALAVRRLGAELGPERLLASRASDEELAARRIQSRRALAWGWTSVGAVYLLGGWLQSRALVPGLVLTLWVLVPALALLAARGTARRAGEPLARTLGLVRPRPLHVLGALLCAPALAQLVRLLVAWQSRYLELPPLELPGLETLGEPALLFLFALSPGFAEELLFRGAILSGLRRDLPARRVIGWQALLFGAAHASILRLLPTSLVGALLAGLTLRARSLWPAIVLHAGYNAAQVLSETHPAWMARPLWLAAPLGLACFARRGRP